MQSRHLRSLVIVGVVAVLAAACGSDAPTQQLMLPTTVAPPSTTTTIIATTVATTPATTAPPAPTDEQLVADCAAYIPIGAIKGEQQPIDLWNFVGQDVAALPALCASLLESEPALVEAYAAALAEFEASGG